MRALMDRIVELEDDNTGLRMRVHELAAGKKAAEKQVREERKALVDVGADLAESLAREARAVKARDEAVREKEEAVREMADERSSHLCDQATLKAKLELAAAKQEQAAGGAGGARAGDLMSRPGLAVSTSPSPQRRQARRGKKNREKGEGEGEECEGGACTQAECVRMKRENARLKRENAVSSGPNTPSGILTIANIARRKFKGILGLAYRHGSRPKRERGGQPGHRGCSNSDPVEALFHVPAPTECPDCHVDLDDARPGTTRRWLRLGKWMLLGLVASDERAAEMLRTSEVLAGHGASSRPACVSVSRKRGLCTRCGKVFEMPCGAVTRGTGASREDVRVVKGLSGRNTAGAIKRHLQSQHGFALQEGSVRAARGASRDAVKRHNAKVPARMGAEPHHRNDESKIRGSDGGGGGDGGGRVLSILESATRAAGPKHLWVLAACTSGLVYIRLRNSRSKPTLAEAYRGFVHVKATTDEYAGQPCEERQSDQVHLVRRTEHEAVRAYGLLHRAGRMGPDDLLAATFEEWEWAGRNMDRIMGAPGSNAVRRLLDDGSPVPPPEAPSPAPLEDGSGRRRDMADARAAGDEIGDESEAARLRGAVKAYLRFSHLCMFLRCWDTASEEAAAALRDLVATEIVPLYGGGGGRGGGHPVATALTNALPTMFYALSTQGMPFDSIDIEQVFGRYLRPYRNAHIMVQSVWGMTVTEEELTFDAMCERNGIDPCDGLDRLMACPDWFAADDGGSGRCGCGSATPEGCRHADRPVVVQRYMPTGPGPPVPEEEPPPLAER